MSTLLDRIDRTREAWSNELEVCRNDILDTVRIQHAVSRLVVEFDYLLVEAKIALEARDARIDKFEAENGALKEAGQGLVNCLPDLELEIAEEGWGVTNANVVRHWRDKLDALLTQELV